MSICAARGFAPAEMATDTRMTMAMIRMTTGDKFWLALTLTASRAAPFAADTIMPVAHSEGPAAVQVADKPDTWIPITEDIPTDSPAELWSIEPEPMEPNYDYIPLDKPLAEALVSSCEEWGVPVSLALGVIEVESNFVTEAVNPVTGCYGLMQLNPRYFPADLVPAENIQTGVAYLGELLERYSGDQGAALTAYNAGRDTGDRTYANAVLAAAERWAEQ